MAGATILLMLIRHRINTSILKNLLFLFPFPSTITTKIGVLG